MDFHNRLILDVAHKFVGAMHFKKAAMADLIRENCMPCADVILQNIDDGTSILTFELGSFQETINLKWVRKPNRMYKLVEVL